jgi:hypothetical protein
MYEAVFTREFLLSEYVEKKKTKSQIAREAGTTVTTLNKYCVRHNIPTNSAFDHRSMDLAQEPFGRLVAEERGPNDAHGKVRWWCSCTCGRRKLINASSLIRGLSDSCGCANSENGRRGGYQEISASYWRRARQSAEDRGIEFGLSQQEAWEIYESQGQRCSFTSLKVSFCPNSNRRYSQTASLDRIDSKRGYVLGNVQVVHKVVNLMKSFLTQDEFIAMCNLVAAMHPMDAGDCLRMATRTILRKMDDGSEPDGNVRDSRPDRPQ